MDDLEQLFPELQPVLTAKNPPAASTPSTAQPLRLSGSFREQSAFRLNAPRQMTQLRSVAYLAGTGAWSDNFSYKASGWLWYDAVYDLTRHYPQAVEDDQKIDGQIRDTYIDYSHENWDVRVGKQQIVWGEAVGSFYADVVNARDLRELVLQDFDLIRIPEWGTDLEYTFQNFHAEGIWLPFPEMDKIARPGAEFAPPIPVPAGFQTQFGSAETPTRSLENSEVGGRLSLRVSGWDLAAFHLRTWDKSPIYRTTIDPFQGLITLTETHPRLTQDGFTFAKAINDVVYKGEFVYSSKKFFQSTDPTVPDGLVAKDEMDYLLGADYNFAKWRTAYQLGQQVIRDYQNDLFQLKRVSTTAAFFIRRELLNDRLEPEITLVKSVDSWDVMARPRVGYKLGSNWRLITGMDLLGGPVDGTFGQFRGHSRYYAEVRFDF